MGTSERVAGNSQHPDLAAQLAADANIRTLERSAKAMNAFAEAVERVARASTRAAEAGEQLSRITEKLGGTEAVITIRFEVNDTAVTGHPLLGEDVAAAEAALIAMAEAGPLGKAVRGDHS